MITGVLRLVAFCVLLASLGCSPRNKAECIKSNVKSGMSDAVAANVIEACNEEFSKEQPPPVRMSNEELQKLTAKLKFTPDTFGTSPDFSGTVYNGTGRRVCALRFDIQTSDENVPKSEYWVDVNILPYAVGDFRFRYLEGRSYTSRRAAPTPDWHISAGIACGG